MARIVAADRRKLADVLAGRISPALAALRAEMGPPETPSRPTGWYRCGDGYYRVGSGPYPEYRPPGLRWRLYWTIPKPDDVPWEDEVEPEVAPAFEVAFDAIEPCGVVEPTADDLVEVAAAVGELAGVSVVVDPTPPPRRNPVKNADQLRFAW